MISEDPLIGMSIKVRMMTLFSKWFSIASAWFLDRVLDQDGDEVIHSYLKEWLLEGAKGGPATLIRAKAILMANSKDLGLEPVDIEVFLETLGPFENIQYGDEGILFEAFDEGSTPYCEDYGLGKAFVEQCDFRGAHLHDIVKIGWCPHQGLPVISEILARSYSKRTRLEVCRRDFDAVAQILEDSPYHCFRNGTGVKKPAHFYVYHNEGELEELFSATPHLQIRTVDTTDPRGKNAAPLHFDPENQSSDEAEASVPSEKLPSPGPDSSG